MSETNDETEKASARASELRARAVAIYGERIRVVELGGRPWVLSAPKGPTFRALWQSFKCDQSSNDPTTRVDAPVKLAKALLVPFDPAGTVKGEREAFDALGDEFPALLDLLGEAAGDLAFGPFPSKPSAPATSSTPPGETTTSPPTT